MLVRRIEKQLENLEYEYQDSNYFPDRNMNVHTEEEMNYTEENDPNNPDFDIRVSNQQLRTIRDILERYFEIRIMQSDYKTVKEVYNFFVANRLENIADIITEYIINNIDLLYNEYVEEVNNKEIDRIQDVENKKREFIVIEKVLQYIVSDAITLDLSEYIPTSMHRFLNENVEIIPEGVSPYDLLTSTVITNDLHHILNLCELIKINLDKEEETRRD